MDLVRNIQNPQDASKKLVDHALARFSTDNLSVMIVRFDPKKLQDNTTSNIGVETEENRDKSAISEVEMIVAEARRHSTSVREGALEDEDDTEKLQENVIRETEEEQEYGPEFTPEGKEEADKILAEKKASGAGTDKKKPNGS